jgi:hypothetical protein
MPFNQTKKYPELLDILSLSEKDRTESLKMIFKRDIEENPNLNFRNKKIYPIKGEEPNMQLLFRHLTTEEIEVNEEGSTYCKRVFEKERSQRLHWIRYHLEEHKKDNIEIFSVKTRDQKKRQDIIRTYIYDKEQKYVIVLEPQRNQRDYYLLTAYHLNKDYGEKSFNKKLQYKLPDIY